MTNEEIAIKQRAEEFARKNKGAIAKEVTNHVIFLPDEFPVSVFMAGSPGAGKTESSRNLIKRFTKEIVSLFCVLTPTSCARDLRNITAQTHLFL